MIYFNVLKHYAEITSEDFYGKHDAVCILLGGGYYV